MIIPLYVIKTFATRGIRHDRKVFLDGRLQAMCRPDIDNESSAPEFRRRE
jgi:hypothetical protein